ncbi:MAG: methyltransferase domain-containing protein [Acidimicrobiales bacterium]
MLTVDYDRLGLRPGMWVLDLGSGFGRHAFETARRGAHVVAVDLATDELVATRATFQAMAEAGEIAGSGTGERVSCSVARADGAHLPFASGSFDRIIASEVLEHVPDDLAVMAELHRVLRPGGRMAATVPAAVPEQICWWLNEAYHAPISVGGHVRIYGRPELRAKLAASGFVPVGDHRAHALHSPYWWLKCAVGLGNDRHPLVRAYHKLLVWDITDAPRLTRTADRWLNPVLGKSLVVYADKPATIGATEPATGQPAGAGARA